jgi:hypothetical protein
MCLVKTNSISGMLIGSLSEKAGAADIKAQSALDKAGLAENKAGAALGKSKAAEEAVGKAQEKADAVAKEATRLRAQLIKQDLRAHLLQGNKRRGAFVKHIKGFSGQTFDIRYCPNPDNEILFLSMQLMATISAGKWQPKEIGKSLGCGTGIVIFLDPRASKSTESAAAALQIALFEAGLVRTPKTEFARSEGRPAAPGEDLLEPSSVDTILVVVQAHP